MFKSEDTLVEFKEEAGIADVIEALGIVQQRNPHTTVSIGVPADADSYEAKPLTAIRELNVNGKNQLVFVNNSARSTGETLARALLKAARVREESYDLAAANKATERHKITGVGFPYYESFYTVTLHEACQTIEPANLRVPVYAMLSCSWNDVIEWAKDTVNDACGLYDLLNRVTDSASPNEPSRHSPQHEHHRSIQAERARS